MTIELLAGNDTFGADAVQIAGAALADAFLEAAFGAAAL